MTKVLLWVSELKKQVTPFASSVTLGGLLFLPFILSLGSCSTTKVQTSGACSTYISMESQCLVPWLPRGNEGDIREIVRQLFLKEGIRIKFMDEEEWNLSAAGIPHPLDTAQYAKLTQIGYSHFLLIRELGYKEQTLVQYFTPQEMIVRNELASFAPGLIQGGNESDIMLELVPLTNPNLTQTIRSKTIIKAFGIGHNDGGETQINPTSTLSARNKAIKKGLKKLFKECKN